MPGNSYAPTEGQRDLMRESPRIRRLHTDLKSLERLREDSTIFDFTAYGNPPESYRVKFRGQGLHRPNGRQVQLTSNHEVAIRLGASYPRVMPELEWLSSIFHPNISGSGVICLGGYGTYWVPSLNLDELCEMLWDMVRFQNYDPSSPYNRDAARWVETQHEFVLPVDARPVRDNMATAQPRTAVREPIGAPEILFLDASDEDIVDAEIVGPDEPDILIIE